ncbi:type II secretion system F family protein [Candidatus Saganbacteria bacterium CG08_land_8_20_14_0_20_45_16]|uniref:Type II secretion system F family protein n=1 Tax=Candidatus Saganbacteria bacterium CG08_land_8_20_14_0_20_45_16 TaxID=2014293 RepID=A0A2H0XXN5_UNCSA|nr:MAG: type II secretion system F family protein [Candidatus Saganbacteria bacterium CG08_land_8_20_14_0_20_45_16]
MTKFEYKARDQNGALSVGVVEAESASALARQLGGQGIRPISILKKNEFDVSVQLNKWLASFQKIRKEEVIVFARQLASVLEAGIPLVDGLEAVVQQLVDKKFQAVIFEVKKSIEGGESFSDSLDKHRDVFEPLIIHMVRAGEKAGILDDVLERVSSLLEKDLETANKIKSATRYPIIVLVTLGIAFTILTTFVIPRFSSFFGAFKAELPLPTRILVGINFVIQHYWYWIIGLVGGLIFTLRHILATDKGRYGWDKLILQTPVFGALFIKIYLSRFARMLSAMIKSGIPILEALLITSATVENKVLSGAIVTIRDEVSSGKNLAEPMKAAGLFPPIAVSMVAIGERAGTLEKMLNKVADYFDREADYTIDNLTPLLEPILIFGLASLMLLFALGIFLPMWDLIKVFKTY